MNSVHDFICTILRTDADKANDQITSAYFSKIGLLLTNKSTSSEREIFTGK